VGTSFLGPGGQPIPLGTSTGVPPPNYAQEAADIAKGLKDAGWLAEIFAYYHASRQHGVTVAWSIFLSIVDEVLALLVKLYGLFQGKDNPGFYQLVSNVVEDLIGVEFDIGVAGFGRAGASNVGGNQAIGGKFLEVLTAVIGTSRPLTPQGGLTAAQGFLGFLINFAIRESNIEFLSSLIPEEYRFGEGVVEYGHAVARSLGLGRMARLAFTPLINILIADPLKWYLNSQYRPTLLNEAMLVRSNVRGLTLTPDFATQLSWLGYTDENINALQEDTYQRPPVADLFLLNRYGEIQDNDLTRHVKNLGTDDTTAGLMIEAEKLKQFETAVAEEFAWYKTLARERFIDPFQFRDRSQSLGIDSTTVEQASHFITAQIETPFKRVSLAEIQQAYIAGLVDLSEYEQFLINAGYTAADTQILIMLELNKQVDHAAQVAVAQYKYNKAKAAAAKKGEPIPPPPPLLA